MSTKLYGLYLAYSKNELLPDELAADKNTPLYPPKMARVRCYGTPYERVEAYANTCCPASRCFDAESEAEFTEKVEALKKNFTDEAWLKVNIHPFI